MIELNDQTVKKIVTIELRKRDWSIELRADENRPDPYPDPRFNVGKSSRPDHRILIKPLRSAFIFAQILGKIIGEGFHLVRDDKDYEIYVRESFVDKYRKKTSKEL